MQMRQNMAFGETQNWKITEGLFQGEEATCGTGQGRSADGGFGHTSRSGAELGCCQRGDLVQFSKKEKLQEEKKHI